MRCALSFVGLTIGLTFCGLVVAIQILPADWELKKAERLKGMSPPNVKAVSVFVPHAASTYFLTSTHVDNPDDRANKGRRSIIVTYLLRNMTVFPPSGIYLGYTFDDGDTVAWPDEFSLARCKGVAFLTYWWHGARRTITELICSCASMTYRDRGIMIRGHEDEYVDPGHPEVDLIPIGFKAFTYSYCVASAAMKLKICDCHVPGRRLPLIGYTDASSLELEDLPAVEETQRTSDRFRGDEDEYSGGDGLPMRNSYMYLVFVACTFTFTEVLYGRN